jgi:hypothetical protein
VEWFDEYIQQRFRTPMAVASQLPSATNQQEFSQSKK